MDLLNKLDNVFPSSDRRGSILGEDVIHKGDIPFHEIRGYGTQTEGGLAGTVIRVTNLNNEGPKSFQPVYYD